MRAVVLCISLWANSTILHISEYVDYISYIHISLDVPNQAKLYTIYVRKVLSYVLNFWYSLL